MRGKWWQRIAPIGARLGLGVLLGGGWFGAARADDPMGFVRANQWSQAAAAVADAPDPVARKLVTFYRLLDPGAATPGEIAAFIAANPDWPDQALLARRRQQAIAADADPADAAAQCVQDGGITRITLPAALARCADALATASPQGNSGSGLPQGISPAVPQGTAGTVEAADAARRAWAAGFDEPGATGPFLQRWSAVLTPADEWARFAALLRTDPAAAAAQIGRLATGRQQAARAWLALRRNTPDAAARAGALPAADQALPGLALATATWLRRGGRDGDALTFWQAHGFAAERAAPAARRTAFWNERDILARDLLAAGDAAGAFTMADDTAQTAPVAIASSGFLAGFIALTRLHEPSVAAACFHRLTAASHAAITAARGHYWLGRAAAAAGADPDGEYRAAAAFPTTFYGQLAARALGEDPATLIDATQDPRFTRAQAWAFTGHELVRAALLLTAWSQPDRARAFLFRMAEVAPDPAEQALAARLALALGLPETAVSIARRVGLEGRMLPQAGWPMPVDPPAAAGVDPAVVLALIRQESSFDRGAVSPSGARGLMQLLPGTAEQVAALLGAAIQPVALTDDAARNMQLGTAYLAQLLARYHGSLPLALAAYNAGPHRVDDWLEADGTAPRTAADMIDWIELIPFGETRNYVQRVLENTVVYLARRSEAGASLTAQWMPPPGARQ